LEEPDRRLRKEVLEFFTRNLMDWPQRSALRTTAEAPRPQTQSPKTPASEFVESPRDALGTESPNQSEPDHAATSSTPPKANPARPGSSEAVLFHGSLEINGGEHEAIEFELEKGSVVYGFVRETSGQPFDFYIMDRRNYAEFCESRNSREILEEYDRTALEFRRTIPKSGVWVFVVDTFHKQNDREVVLEIRESAGG
jgi:hypothetical protein